MAKGKILPNKAGGSGRGTGPVGPITGRGPRAWAKSELSAGFKYQGGDPVANLGSADLPRSGYHGSMTSSRVMPNLPGTPYSKSPRPGQGSKWR